MHQTLIILAALTASAMADSQPGDHPCVTVGRVAKAPVIDGTIDAGEWQNAAVIGVFLQRGARAVAQPATTTRLTFGERALYVAVRCVEPDRRRPRGHERAHDDRAFEDDCVQLFVAPEDLREAGQAQISFGGYEGAYSQWYQDIKVYYEFTVNCMGGMTEARNDVRDWDAPWEAKVGPADGSWVAELAIPFRSLGIDHAPEGALWGLNVCRHRQPEVYGWSNPSWGGYRALSFGAMVFASECPVVRQRAVPAAEPGPNALEFTVRNPTSRQVLADVTVTPSGGESIRRELTVPSEGVAETEVAYELAGQGNLRGAFEVKLRGSEVPLLSGFVPLHIPAPHSLSLRYYAVPGIVEGTVHVEDEAITKAVLTLQPAKGAPAKTEASLAGAKGAVLRLNVNGVDGDRFTARLRALADDGRVVDKRKRELTIPVKPRWLGTKAGLPLGVLPPWTPMQVRGKTIEMLGKRLRYGDFALPESVVSAGAELLAKPMRVVLAAGGQAVRWRDKTCRVTDRAEDRVIVESVWRNSALELRVRSEVEYDGFCWNDVTLTPLQPVTIDRMALEIPLRRDVCRYVYRGHAQEAHALSPFGLQCPVNPNVDRMLWIGDESRGLAWMAESLDWLEARDRGRQVEVIPGGRESLWRTRFIDTSTPLREPYVARFALHVTPAKPVSLRKSRIFHGAYYGLESDRLPASLEIPANGNFDLARGTLECWVKPTFDPSEKFDESLSRSAYIRQFFTLITSANEVLILYYNPDDRNMRIVTKKADGTYPVVLSGPGTLPTDQWSYVGMSWGDKLRLRVNEQVSEHALKGTVKGTLEQSKLTFTLAAFQIDDLRLSKSARPLDHVPQAPLAVDDDTLLLDSCDRVGRPDRFAGATSQVAAQGCHLIAGRFGQALARGDELRLDQLAKDGKRIVIFHETWSRYQGYPDLEQVPKLKKLADACHARGMLFLVYFNWSMSTAAPEWEGFRDDLVILPDAIHYHRNDVPQDCYGGCVNGPYGDLLLDGIAKLADQAGIDGVYMDGTTVPWNCGNPTHPGCGQYAGDGTYRPQVPLRAVRRFMKRLRNIFAQRGKHFFLDAHTGGAVNLATQSFCDGYYDGEQLARYKPGFRLSADTFMTGYRGRQFGFRGELLPSRHTMDQALAISLVHDAATRGQPAEVDLALAPYEDGDTRFIGYWEKSPLYRVEPPQVLGSLYLKPDGALLVLGSQSEETTACMADIRELLKRLPRGVRIEDALTHRPLSSPDGRLSLSMPGRSWRIVEFRTAPRVRS